MPLADLPYPDLSRLDEQSNWLEAIPVLLALPLGRLYVNYLLFRTVRMYRANARYIAKILSHHALQKRSVEGRHNLLASSAEYLGDCQRTLSRLEPFKASQKLFYAPLVWWVAKIKNELGDLAETCALGAEPGMEALAKELSDAL